MSIPAPKTGILRTWARWMYDPETGERVLVHTKVVRDQHTKVVMRVDRKQTA